jgi:hypothetical protein
MGVSPDVHEYIYANVGEALVTSPDADEYVYENIGFPRPIQSLSIEYVYENTGANSPLVADTTEYVYENIAYLSILPFGKPHIYLPLVDPAGNLLTYADVTFIDVTTGLPSTAALYRTSDSLARMVANPVTFIPGIVDIWVDDPARFDLTITGPNGYANTFRGIDLAPSPNSSAKATHYTHFDTAPLVGRVMLSDGTTQYWDYLPQIAAHQHPGAEAGSVRLDLGDGPADTTIDQTWVGDAPGDTAANATSLSMFGSGAEVSAGTTHATLLGSQTHALVEDAVTPDRGVAIGHNSEVAAPDAVSLGANTGQTGVDGPITLPSNSSDVMDVYIDLTQISLRNCIFSVDESDIGTAVDIPSVPLGVTNPLWLRGDTAIPGNLVTSADVQIGASGSTVGFYGQPGAVTTTIVAGASDALLSLLSALQAYGLLTIGGGS